MMGQICWRPDHCFSSLGRRFVSVSGAVFCSISGVGFRSVSGVVFVRSRGSFFFSFGGRFFLVSGFGFFLIWESGLGAENGVRKCDIFWASPIKVIVC